MFTLTWALPGVVTHYAPMGQRCNDTSWHVIRFGARLTRMPQNGAGKAILHLAKGHEIASNAFFFRVYENDFLTMETTFLNVALS